MEPPPSPGSESSAVINPPSRPPFFCARCNRFLHTPWGINRHRILHERQDVAARIRQQQEERASFQRVFRVIQPRSVVRHGPYFHYRASNGFSYHVIRDMGVWGPSSVRSQNHAFVMHGSVPIPPPFPSDSTGNGYANMMMASVIPPSPCPTGTGNGYGNMMMALATASNQNENENEELDLSLRL